MWTFVYSMFMFLKALLSCSPLDCVCVCVCVFQENVMGAHCDLCKQGFFNLQGSNPEGCTECFCFGVSGVCESSTWSTSQVTHTHRNTAHTHSRKYNTHIHTTYKYIHKLSWVFRWWYPTAGSSLQLTLPQSTLPPSPTTTTSSSPATPRLVLPTPTSPPGQRQTPSWGTE